MRKQLLPCGSHEGEATRKQQLPYESSKCDSNPCCTRSMNCHPQQTGTRGAASETPCWLN
eukprot:879160-Pelagomonas_calceolata.AAC.1